MTCKLASSFPKSCGPAVIQPSKVIHAIAIGQTGRVDHVAGGIDGRGQSQHGDVKVIVRIARPRVAMVWMLLKVSLR